MKHGEIVKLVLKDGDCLVGYFQYKDRGTIFVAPYSNGMYAIGTMSEDIKTIVEL